MIRWQYNWLFLLRKSWSVRWQAIAGLLDTAQLILPVFSDKFTPGPFAGLILAISLLGIVARLMRQPKDGL